jgi:cytosine/adenosine deaminase-related metal-dependent hydrolase
MARVGAMLKGAELLLSGVTCVSDMFHHTNMGSLASLGVVDGLEAMGLRGVVAFGAEDVFDPHPVAAFLDEHQALADRCAAAPRVGFRMGVGTLLGQSDELLAASARAARERGWAVHTHLAEVRQEVVQARMRWAAAPWNGRPTSGCWRCRCWPPTASGSTRPRSPRWPGRAWPRCTTRWPT